MKAYVEPDIRIYEFDTEEILTASGKPGLNDVSSGGNFDAGNTGDEVIVFPTSADGGIYN